MKFKNTEVSCVKLKSGIAYELKTESCDTDSRYKIYWHPKNKIFLITEIKKYGKYNIFTSKSKTLYTKLYIRTKLLLDSASVYTKLISRITILTSLMANIILTLICALK